MDIDILRTEIQTDPLGRGYSGMDDAAVAVSLNDTIDRTLNKSSMTGDEVFAATDATEWAALTDTNKQLWMSFCGRDIDPFGAANVALVQNLFGGGSTTQSALVAARVDSVSRGVELGLGLVRPGDVNQARL